MREIKRKTSNNQQNDKIGKATNHRHGNQQATQKPLTITRLNTKSIKICNNTKETSQAQPTSIDKMKMHVE